MTLTIDVFNSGIPGAAPSSKSVFYASEENELFRYDVDVASASLSLQGSILMQTQIMYAWSSPASRYFYTGSSDRDALHFLNAFRIDPASGALLPHCQPVVLPQRVINITLDKNASHVLVAFKVPGTVNVYRLTKNGEIGEMVAQPAQPDGGIYTHQVRVSPSGDKVFAVARGNPPTDKKPEDPGSLTLFKYQDGILTKTDKIVYGPGLGPRHLDVHPAMPWVYVSFERGNKLYVYSLKNGTLSKEPLFIKETLSDPSKTKRGRQMAGAIHFHPNGKFLYVSNRSDGTEKDEQSGQMVYAGGENNIAVYSIDQNTGEPTLIQNEDTRGIWPRTFSIDPGGQLLVAANQSPRLLRRDSVLSLIPKSLSVFRIGLDGRLEYVRKYDVGGNDNKQLFWAGFVGLKDRGR